jgi:hypothetical protein
MLTRKIARRVLPIHLRQAVYNTIYYYPVAIVRLWGWHERVCCICNHQGKFRAYGFPPSYDARCPRCNSLERHRLLKLWFDQHYDRATPLTLLHFAPEPCLSKFLRPLVKQYVTADIQPGKADTTLNIEKIDLPNSTYDLIICSHVLEHVNDTIALSEIYRILRPGGRALLMTPLVEGWSKTYENLSVTGDQARELHFGQYDHLRFYGSDIRQRISDAGFCLEEFTAVEPAVHSYGLSRGEKVFVASKPR